MASEPDVDVASRRLRRSRSRSSPSSLPDSAGATSPTRGRTRSATLPFLESTLAYARRREYVGWDYADGMSSALVRRLPVDNKWLTLAVQETIKRAPVNVRPLFGVERRRSYKGAALFALANLDAAALTSEERYREEARALLDWLVENRCVGYAGFCGGHQHALQELDTRQAVGTPDVVSTSYAVRALLRGADAGLGEQYATTALTAANFLFSNLGYEETDVGARIRYRPGDSGAYYTLNANALGARLLLDLYDRFGGAKQLRAAERILDYVVSQQTDSGGWLYRDPPSASHLSMDSFHNGFIVESLLRHREVTGSGRFDDATAAAVAFYRTLFDADGAPHRDESNRYPRDIHDVAEGIVVFSLVDDRAAVERLFDWCLANLYAGDGRFYYQQRRFYTKRITLMRWCQAWMAYALGVASRR